MTNKVFDIYLKAVLARKVQGPVVLDVSGLTAIADYFIICSGRSNRHVSATADFVVSDLRKKGIKPLSVERASGSGWHLIDYGDIIIHIFYEPVRKFYDLEGLWADAKSVYSEQTD